MITRDFSQLWRRSTGECQRFSTFGLIFICHSSSPLSSDGKRNWSLWHIRSPAPLEQVFFSCDFQKGRRNRSFWHIPWCTPRDIALSAIVNVHFNFGSVDIQSFCLGDSAQIPASLILLFAYSNVTFLSVIQISSLLFPNISLIKSDYWGFLGGADIKFSRLHSNKYFRRKHFELIH